MIKVRYRFLCLTIGVYLRINRKEVKSFMNNTKENMIPYCFLKLSESGLI